MAPVFVMPETRYTWAIHPVAESAEKSRVMVQDAVEVANWSEMAMPLMFDVPLEALDRAEVKVEMPAPDPVMGGVTVVPEARHRTTSRSPVVGVTERV